MTTTPQNETPSANPAPLQKTTEQERAAQAWRDVTGVDATKYKREYGSIVRKLPMLVLTNGLAASMAFLLARGKESNAHKAAYDHISGWVMSRLQSTGDLMTWIRQQDSAAYRRATTDTLAYLNWLKRFVEAKGWGEEGNEDAAS